MNSKELYEIRSQCRWFLGGGPPENEAPTQVLTELAREAESDPIPDVYGQGELIDSFERQVAELLGKEAAVFMPSGTMAQQIALRIWSDRSGTKNVAFHPKCHLEIHEQKGYQMLHGLHGILVGEPEVLMTLEDLQGIHEPLAALLLELPQREIGGQLPTWEELTAITHWARQKGIPLHMDGARLWQCTPFYSRELAEISGLFDTVYVSFYKVLGGLTGAALTGPAEFLAEARIWQRRYGGNLKQMSPYILSARKGLREVLGQIETYTRKMHEIAEALTGLDGVEVVPNPPHINMVHIYLRGDKARLEEAGLEIAKKHKVYLFAKLAPSTLPTYWAFEPSVRESTLGLGKEQVREIFEELMERARG